MKGLALNPYEVKQALTKAVDRLGGPKYLAAKLQVSERTVKYWIQGRYSVNPRYHARLEEFAAMEPRPQPRRTTAQMYTRMMRHETRAKHEAASKLRARELARSALRLADIHPGFALKNALTAILWATGEDWEGEPWWKVRDKAKVVADLKAEQRASRKLKTLQRGWV